MALEAEQATFEKELPRLLLEAQGKFALIKGSEVAGIYNTFEDAVKVGYEKFKLTPFMVKQIVDAERVHYFSRDLSACLK